MAKHYWSVGLLTLRRDANMCGSVLNCPTDILKYSFCLQWGGKKNFLSLLRRMGCTLRGVLWKLFHELIFLCFYRNFVLGLVWRALIKNIFASQPFQFWCHSLLCTLCVKEEEEDDEVTDDYLHLVTTQMWLFDNVCCCSFRISFSFSGAGLRLKPFLKAALHLHTENVPTMFKLKKICYSIVILHRLVVSDYDT